MSQQFNQLLESSLPRLTSYALSLTRHRADAEDLVQTTAMLALRAETQFAIGTNFQAWVSRILRNRFLSNCRGKKHQCVAYDDVPESCLARPEQIHEHIYAREVISKTASLSPAARRTLALICGTQLTYEETAKTLACSVGTVKSRLWRARKEMKDLLLGSGETALDAPGSGGQPAYFH